MLAMQVHILKMADKAIPDCPLTPAKIILTASFVSTALFAFLEMIDNLMDKLVQEFQAAVELAILESLNVCFKEED